MSNRLPEMITMKRADEIRPGDAIVEPPFMVGGSPCGTPHLRFVHDIQIFGDDVVINNWDKIINIGNELMVIERRAK